jgi:hypothetical protein
MKNSVVAINAPMAGLTHTIFEPAICWKIASRSRLPTQHLPQRHFVHTFVFHSTGGRVK